MRPKARRLDQHCGPPAGLRRATRQMWFCTWWTGRTACHFCTVPVALTEAISQLQADGISCCYCIVNVHKHSSWAMSRKEGIDWHSTVVDPCLLSGGNQQQCLNFSLKKPHGGVKNKRDSVAVYSFSRCLSRIRDFSIIFYNLYFLSLGAENKIIFQAKNCKPRTIVLAQESSFQDNI